MSKSIPLGPERRNKIIAFMFQHQEQKGIPPSIREIGEAVYISSTSVVNYYLGKLRAEGWITFTPRLSRGTTLTVAGLQLARGLLGMDAHTCPHCGAPTDDAGKYQPKTKIKKRSNRFPDYKVESVPGSDTGRCPFRQAVG